MQSDALIDAYNYFFVLDSNNNQQRSKSTNPDKHTKQPRVHCLTHLRKANQQSSNNPRNIHQAISQANIPASLVDLLSLNQNPAMRQLKDHDSDATQGQKQDQDTDLDPDLVVFLYFRVDDRTQNGQKCGNNENLDWGQRGQ